MGRVCSVDMSDFTRDGIEDIVHKLASADLRDIDLSDADLRGAYLFFADLSGAMLAGATWKRPI